MMEPLISVVVPSYNSARFLPETLASIFAQDGARYEVILVDDGSTDDTTAVLEPYRSRLNYVRQENFGGPSRPRNVGVAAARGELVAVFDSDDVMLPEKLAAATAAFREWPELDLIFTDFSTVGVDGEVLRESSLERYRDFRRYLQPAPSPLAGYLSGRELYSALLVANFIGTSSVVVRRQTLLEAGGFDESLKNSDDRDMWFKLALAGKCFGFLDRICHHYRWRPGNVTQRGARRFPAVLQVLRRQRPHVQGRRERRLLEKRIQSVLLGYAWGMRQEGNLEEALDVYRQALRESWSWPGFQGYLLARLRRLLTR